VFVERKRRMRNLVMSYWKMDTVMGGRRDRKEGFV
jgi:hypothetical protein